MKKGIPSTINSTEKLNAQTQKNTKGGILLYCEEKRVKTIFGTERTVQQWKLANDGSLLLSIKM